MTTLPFFSCYDQWQRLYEPMAKQSELNEKKGLTQACTLRNFSTFFHNVLSPQGEPPGHF